MSDEHNLPSLLDRQMPALIKEIKKGCLSDFADNDIFKTFVNSLKPHIDSMVNQSDWQNNEAFLNLLYEINNQFTNGNGGENMCIESKTFIVGSKAFVVNTTFAMGYVVGALIGGALVAYYYEKKRAEEQKEKTLLVQVGESARNAGQKIGIVKQYPLPEPSYTPHTLLLVISANRLPENFVIGEIDNNKINELISGSAWAYCFADGDEQGNKIMNAVSYSDAPIDYTTEINVFVRLELSAESEIIIQRNKLNIKQKINSNSNGQVLQISKLQSSRSVSSFYEI